VDVTEQPIERPKNIAPALQWQERRYAQQAQLVINQQSLQIMGG